jgi:osmotically inducible protein OsmC
MRPERNLFMTDTTRKSGVIWKGDLINGEGLISTKSQALYEQEYNYRARFENEAIANPEELI